MPTRLEGLDYVEHIGMATKVSALRTPDNKVRLAQNLHYRTVGALTKRNGYTKVNNTQPVN